MRRRIALLGIVALIALFLGFTGCATLQRTTGTHTYVAGAQQLEEIRQILGIEPCPEGTSAVALAIEAVSGGGATVTVRCQ